MASDSLHNRPLESAERPSSDLWLTVSGWIWTGYLIGSAALLMWWFA